jgi:hypothetical protein
MSERKGIGGHHSAAAATTSWLTPPPIIAALGGVQSFDLDPCAFPAWPTARHGYALPETDGLAAGWSGRVWLNPPYTSGEIADWLQKLGDHGRGTALIFARSETDAFQAQVFGRASGLLWLAGRLHFYADDANLYGAHDGPHAWGKHARGFERCELCGVAKANAGAPSVLCAYGQEDLDRLAASGLAGNLHPLRFARFLIVGALSATWREAVLGYMAGHRGPVELSSLYRAMATHPNARRNRHWRAKVRQTLQRAGARRVGPSTWEAPQCA